MTRYFLLLIIALGACAAAFEPAAPFARFTPPPVYRAWWDSVWTHCGRQVRATPARAYDAIEWYQVDAGQFWVGGAEGGWAVGAATESGRIYVTVYAIATGIDQVPKHEMLHMQIGPGAGHPPIFTSCGLR